MSHNFDLRLMNELGARQLDAISAGGATVTHNDEAPKETITFEYGGLIIQYVAQKPDGTLGS